MTKQTATQDNAGLVELLPCPFCGSEARSRDYGRERVAVGCLNMDCRASSMLSLPGESAITAWNTRTPPVETAANADERDAAADMLPNQRGRTFLGDKGYVQAELAEELERCGVRLLAVRRKNQRTQLPQTLRRLVQRLRQIIETVNGQLTEQFEIETNYAHSFWGLCARLYTKLTAHTLCIYLNRLLGNPDWLQIKALAFPQPVTR